MRRSASRFFAITILSILGGPMVLHLIVHDLHHAHASEVEAFHVSEHGGHEHPVVGSSQPQIRTLSRSLPAPATVTAQCTVIVCQIFSDERNLIAFGALRLDDDVGLQPLLSTFLI